MKVEEENVETKNCIGQLKIRYPCTMVNGLILLWSTVQEKSKWIARIMKRRLETGMVRHKALVCPQEDITTEECSACADLRL